MMFVAGDVWGEKKQLLIVWDENLRYYQEKEPQLVPSMTTTFSSKATN